MRPVLVVFAAKAIEALLLPRAVGCRWTRRLRFEDTVHLLVLAVLLGMSGFVSLHTNPQFEPANAEPGQAGERRGRGKRAAVVRAHDLGQAIVTKDPLIGRPRQVARNRGEAVDDKHEAAERIHDGERVAQATVSGAELPLVVACPNLVGSRGLGPYPGRRERPAATPPRRQHQSLSLQDPADGARRWPGLLAFVLLKPGQQLPGTPGRMLAAQLHQPLRHFGRGLRRPKLWSSRSVLQPLHSHAPVPLGPLVPGLAANSVLLTELCHLVQAALQVGNKPESTHLGGLAPSHSGIPLRYPNTSSRNCHPCLRSNLLPMSPVYAVTAPPPLPKPRRGAGSFESACAPQGLHEISNASYPGLKPWATRLCPSGAHSQKGPDETFIS